MTRPANKPNERDQKVIDLRLNDGLGYREIGEQMHISHARVGQILARWGFASPRQDVDVKTSEVFDFICQYKIDHGGNSPTLEEILEGCNLHVSSSANYHIEKLEEMGLIKLIKGVRGIVVVGGEWIPPKFWTDESDEGE